MLRIRPTTFMFIGTSACFLACFMVATYTKNYALKALHGTELVCAAGYAPVATRPPSHPSSVCIAHRSRHGVSNTHSQSIKNVVQGPKIRRVHPRHYGLSLESRDH